MLGVVRFLREQREINLRPDAATSVSRRDYRHRAILLPDGKIQKIKCRCKEALEKCSISTKEAAALIGSLNWAVGAIKFAKANYRALQISQIYALRGRPVSDKTKIALSIADKSDIHWWMVNIEKANGIAIMPGDADVVV